MNAPELAQEGALETLKIIVRNQVIFDESTDSPYILQEHQKRFPKIYLNWYPLLKTFFFGELHKLLA